MNFDHRKISDVGEKACIRDFIKPFFNAGDDPFGVGDDCAMVAFGEEIALLSTDRVPADLTAFRLGLLDHAGLGDYLARLNVSDIAACGGHVIGLLLNLGLPDDLTFEHVQQICRGFGACADRHGAVVLGGDMTNASELSISATAIGRAKPGKVLTRRGARPGDSVFLSKPLGLATAARMAFVTGVVEQLPQDDVLALKTYFTCAQPMTSLGRVLADSGICSSCMDNTDGIGQSLMELAEASRCALVLEEGALMVPSLAVRVFELSELAVDTWRFGAGADFALVGTLRGSWSSEAASTLLGHPLEVVGHAEEGAGVWLESGERKELRFAGWSYFSGCRR